MAASNICPTCGKEIPADAPEGLCPRCLAGIALYNQSQANEPDAEGTSSLPLEQFSRFEILGLLGQGGMSVVYRALQLELNRVVALKVISPGMVSDDVIRRFRQEAEALGRLQHPGIAQIYEYGSVDSDRGEQPYFVLECIAGADERSAPTLRDYAEDQDLDVRARLELVERVAEAVHHAHQKGVIHRDLKPANILVDQNGQPKVLDFGVARLTDSDRKAFTLRTDLGQLVGTLPYMSPEQAGGDPGELDTRSDVYALGVIAYELLCGRLPYELHRRLLHEALRVIREEEPTRLSSVNRALGGDIETIVLKSLAKEKECRYQSAEELAADIRRYLRDEPIEARQPSGWYQFRKFAKRNKAIGLGIAAVCVASLVGLAATGWQAVRASRAESRAAKAATTAQVRLASERAALEEAERTRDAAAHARRETAAARLQQSDLQQQARRAIQEKERAEEGEAAATEKLAAERAALANARQTTDDEIHVRRVAEVNLLGETALRRQSEVRHLLVADDQHDSATRRNEYKSFDRAAPTTTSSVVGRARVRINLGTIAPRGSTFHRSLQSMAQEWKTISGGAVRVVVYPDGTMGGDSDMVRLMRVGTLHAALLTAHGLSDIDPSVAGLQSMPLRFRTLDEFDHVNDQLRPVVAPRVEAKGFVVLSWVDAGWVRYFSKQPVIWPDDLKTRKVFAWEGDPDQFQLMRGLDLHPVALDTGDIQTGLRTGLIDVVAVPPIFALAGRIDAQAPHMLALNWAPLVGAIVVSRETWQRIPGSMHAQLLAAAEAAGSEIRAGSRKEGADAVTAMEQRGLEVHRVTPEMQATWEAMAESELLPRIRGTLAPEEMFDAVQQIVLRYREESGHAEIEQGRPSAVRRD